MSRYHILVPVDFSELSDSALQAAVKMAGLFDGKITPIHVMVPVTEIDEPFAAHIRYDFDKMQQDALARLNEAAAESVPAELLEPGKVIFGNPAQSIVEEARGADLVIMGSHGRTGFSRIMLGSVAEKVLRMSPVPVMVVKSDSDVDNFADILVTTDFSENAKAAYPLALAIAKKTNAKVELLHVLSYGQLDRDETDQLVEDLREERLRIIKGEVFHEVGARVTTRLITSEASPHEAIAEYVSRNPCHLLIMSTVGRTGLNYLMLGSTTANVVRHVPQAVLSVRPPKPA